MSRFIQIHTLTSYPPANLNRDDLGRPKTAMMGGVERLRVSSQSLKRHWRTSDLFQEALRGHLGTRTKDIGVRVRQSLVEKGVTAKNAEQWASDIAGVFGKVEKGKVTTQQLVFISPEEWKAIDTLSQTLADKNRQPSDEEKKSLLKKSTAVDIALFGRMLADSSNFNVEAACQVAHAISVHGVTVEDDYFTAVDDLNSEHDDRGAAHIGETGFASAVFYNYVCIDRQSLLDHLDDDEALANKAIAALTEAIATVSPKGKQNSFGSYAYASYMMIEIGNKQPRSLSASFLSPIKSDFLPAAIQALEKQVEHFDSVYGPCAEQRRSFNAVSGEGNLQSVVELATQS
ncbi:type I-E CRISPR-associated protein Cas7/Cse4/CasC [Kineobactrum salinum]|uniref:Type I-E CRISPR-associated protein Cas7/Cse4/CasC n=1 Tax=Kineobactrum salinum TaxID=2708301 RepID=A0A6C0TXV8_9GAMM|nr:type I-E CRISPR-associated protein Cas7/Cse4/CasC [Kineobactrum salinum]QIB64631.1 type I-E CRISPR-associated protein Cas7/Cse4/CasC [Kineobactrum salinum]